MSGKDNITVSQIVKTFLVQNNYDGLYSNNEYCACAVEDLMPCEEYGIGGCSPGYKGPCNEDYEFDMECDWHIYPKRPVAQPPATSVTVLLKKKVQ